MGDEPSRKAAGLEALVVKGNKLVAPARYREAMSEAEARVCRIEGPKGQPHGTGFLVGADLVLTCRHVYREIESGGAVARFDYKSAGDLGEVVRIEPEPLASSEEAELDFVLLRLAAPEGKKRGYFKPSRRPHDFKVGQQLHILQHPNGRPLQLGQGAVGHVVTVPPRVTYTTNTEPGSSGSPAFNMEWQLVAMHQQGEKGKNNAGIPIAKIWERIRQARQAGRPVGPRVVTREVELRYLRRLIEEAEVEAAPFTPLRGQAETRAPEPEPSQVRKHRQTRTWLAPLGCYGRDDQQRQVERESYHNILEAYPKVRRAVVLGDPGAGKSTTLWRLCLDLAERARDDEEAPLPVVARLGKWTSGESLVEFLARDSAPEIGAAVERLGKSGRLVLLLDGLNEVPTAKRADKAKDVAVVLREWNGCPGFLVSCRREDYTGPLDLGLDKLTLENLTPPQIRAAVRKWVEDDGKPPEVAERFFWQLAGDERLASVWRKWESAGVSEEQFWSATEVPDAVYRVTGWEDRRLWNELVHKTGTLLELAANPFMLTMLFEVWERKETLPRNRGELFGNFVLCLLGREHLLKPNLDTPTPTAEGKRLLKNLSALAWRMQNDRVRGADDSGVLTAVSRADAEQALGGEGPVKQALDATLLEGDREIRFRHQLLQEYFTAKALESELGKKKPASVLWPPKHWWARSGWEESAVLLAGIHAQDASPVIRWLKDAQPEVAAQCILESGAKIEDEKRLLRELQAAWLPRLTSDPAPEARAAVGRAMGRLKLDPRRGVGVVNGVPEIDWVEIPAGEFIYQDEKTLRKNKRFFMARYPVTNVQFQAFLDAEDGHHDNRWWHGLTNPLREPAKPEWSESNHPRETVNWHEAMAFCAWLSHRSGSDARLPTEWEWDWAARGTDGKVYPWGEKYEPGYANIDERLQGVGPHYLSRTSAVGIYPDGASLEGVLDLIGNVWEWCLNEFSRPTRIQAGEEELRVLRGGSWCGRQGGARADCRYRGHPHFRVNNFGFRVVCSVPITRTRDPEH